MNETELPDPPAGLTMAVEGVPTDPTLLEAADRAARQWLSSEYGSLPPGSPAHARATRAMFRETFNPYRPAVIDWPVLEPATRQRLISLPIWDIAVHTEGKARLRMKAYADTSPDPDWREAVGLNAWEESRHKHVLSRLVEAYGIKLQPEPEYQVPRDTEWAYLVTGYSECIDSFFAFGLFALARRSGFFPPELVETFEPVIQEECRHILLFANWLAAHRANLPWWRRPYFEARVAAVWVFLAAERVGLARGMDEAEAKQDNNFTLTGSQAVADEMDVATLMQLCLEENDRRFAGYDARLRRPTTTPFLARMALGTIRAWRWVRGKKQRHAA